MGGWGGAGPAVRCSSCPEAPPLSLSLARSLSLFWHEPWLWMSAPQPLPGCPEACMVLGFQLPPPRGRPGLATQPHATAPGSLGRLEGGAGPEGATCCGGSVLGLATQYGSPGLVWPWSAWFQANATEHVTFKFHLTFTREQPSFRERERAAV